MNFELKDLTGLGQPFTKLIEVVSAGIGTLYRPRAIRNEGAEEALKLRAIELARANAAEEVKAIALTGQLNRLAVLVENDPDILRRAKSRLAMQEVEGQLNIENIADAAIKYLPSQASSEPVADEWRRRFFRYAEDVSNVDMQEVWAQVLAGEIERPGTCSLRALSVLHQLSSTEALLFQKVCALAFESGHVLRPEGVGESVVLETLGLHFSEQLELHSCGLLQPGDNLVIHPVVSAGAPIYLRYHGDIVLVVPPPGGAVQPLPALTFTATGRELMKFTGALGRDDYLTALFRSWRALNYTVGGSTKVLELWKATAVEQ